MRTLGRVPSRGSVGDVFFLIGVVVVPVFAGGPHWLLGGGIAVSCLGMREWRRTAVMAAYAAPVVFGAPWPVHCATACMTWLLLNRSWPDRTAVARFRFPLSRWPVLVLLGAGAGAGAVVLDRIRVLGGAFGLAFPRPSLPLLIGAVLVVAALNATAEEGLWRLVVDREIAAQPIGWQYGFQALSFGLAHWNGIPNGPVGALAAGAFSALLVAVRRKAGLGGAVLTHWVADSVIFWFVADNAVYGSIGFAVSTLDGVQ